VKFSRRITSVSIPLKITCRSRFEFILPSASKSQKVMLIGGVERRRWDFSAHGLSWIDSSDHIFTAIPNPFKRRK
jgi:hypothetical protein